MDKELRTLGPGIPNPMDKGTSQAWALKAPLSLPPLDPSGDQGTLGPGTLDPKDNGQARQGPKTPPHIAPQVFQFLVWSKQMPGK